MAYYIGFLIIFLIVCLSIAAFTVILERTLVFFQFKTFQKALKKILGEKGGFKEKFSVINLDLKINVESVLEVLERGNSLSNEVKNFKLESFVEGVENFLFRRLIVLQTGATVSPTLGILGTVVGMIAAFNGFTGGEVTHRAMFIAGILQALYSTAFGLSLSIVCMIAFNYFNKKIEDIGDDLLLDLKEALYKDSHG